MTGRRPASHQPPLVVLGGSHNALSAARSLGTRGIPVHVLSDGRGLPSVRTSRYVTTYLEVPANPEPGLAWRDWLESFPPGAVVIAGGDEGLQFIAEHRDTLTVRGHHPVQANDEAVLALLDKERSYELAEKAGVEAPYVKRVATVDEAVEVASRIGFPCALKPVFSHSHARLWPGRSKAFVIHSVDDVATGFRKIHLPGLELLVTELVPGPDDAFCSYYSYLDEEGRPLLHFTKRKLRQYPTRFGLGSFHSTAWVPEAMEIGLRMFRAAGVVGIGNIEFKRDARDGRLKMIECNLRLTAADELLRRAGVDLAHLAYERALGRTDQDPQPEPVRGSFREGLQLWFPGIDLRAYRGYRAAGELTFLQWIRTLRAPMYFPTFSLRDPRPFFAGSRRTAARASHRVWDRLTAR